MMKFLFKLWDQSIKALIPIASILIFSLINCSEQKPDLSYIVQQRYKESQLNLIPDSAGITPSYWCTWSSQNFATDTFTVRYAIGGGHHSHTADNLTEEAVFRNPGWEKKMPQKIKKDLYLMFDLGWDIPADSYTDKTVIEVAFECGYENTSYFNRQFRIYRDASPKSFREQIRNKIS